MTLSVSEMKVRLEDYLTDASKNAFENVYLFADIAENEGLPDTMRREAEEHCTYHRSRVTTYASLIVELRSGHLAAIIEDAVRECTADLETKLRNRNEQIADLDKHRHDLYQERDELLHRIEALEARLSR